MATKIVTASELKANLASVMAQLATDATPIYVTQHGKPNAVLMSYQEHEALREKLEDLEDALAMQQALARPEEEAMSLEEYERQRLAQLRR
ncbi:MAG: type II toxin-antitoxin system Phd/YefM family antitoxin [Dehalococcoidia bacterium]|nr:type II toxin-antitoxin system Phd/YefM family antitoxin [Dehalococcoidia bacterium]